MHGISIWETEFPFEKGVWDYIRFITLFQWCSRSPFLSLKFTPISHISWVYMGLKLWGGACKEGKKNLLLFEQSIHTCLEIQPPFFKQISITHIILPSNQEGLWIMSSPSHLVEKGQKEKNSLENSYLRDSSLINYKWEIAILNGSFSGNIYTYRCYLYHN